MYKMYDARDLTSSPSASEIKSKSSKIGFFLFMFHRLNGQNCFLTVLIIKAIHINIYKS